MTEKADPSRVLEIPSQLSELEQVVDEAELFFAACFEDDERIYAGVLLASEAVTNAIEHGNQLDKSKVVFIEFRKTATTAEIWVEDEGEGFAREDIVDPLSEERLLSDGGRGIFLMEKIADKVVMEKGGRRIGLVFKR